MSKTLTSNVHVDGKWYGPDYPQNGAPPDGSVTNSAAYAEPTTGFADNRSLLQDYAPGAALSTAAAPEAVPDGNVDEVLDWVGADKVRAQRALEAEQAKATPRVTLVDALEDQLTS